MEDIELRKVWITIRKRILLVLLIPLVAAVLSGLVSVFVLKPQYEANTTLLVNQQLQNIQFLYDTVLANQALVKTYSDIIRSYTIENTVITTLHLPYSTDQLNAMIHVSSPDQSQVIDVSVFAPNEPLAVHIANSLASTFQQKAKSLMNVADVQIVDPAVLPADPSPVLPRKSLNVAVSCIVGLMVSIGLAFLLEYLDTRITNEEKVKQYLDWPVFGSIVEH